MVFKKKIDYQFRKALNNEKDQIWRILKDAIHRRKKDNSNQWQDGYPNRDIIQNDLDQGYGFVLTTNDQIIGYCALLINDEPEYLKINGKWLSNNNFIVFHRLAIGKEFLNKGLATKPVPIDQIGSYAIIILLKLLIFSFFT